MALTQEQKDAIEMGMNEFTHAELAQKHGCSRSTIARVIAAAKAADKQRTETAAAESKEGEETKEDDGNEGSKTEEKPADNFEYVPETEERSTIIELNTDDGLGKLLSSHAQLDPIADAEDETAADTEEAKVDDAAEDKAFEQIMNNEEGEQIGVGPTDAEMESLLHGLLGDNGTRIDLSSELHEERSVSCTGTHTISSRDAPTDNIKA